MTGSLIGVVLLADWGNDEMANPEDCKARQGGRSPWTCRGYGRRRLDRWSHPSRSINGASSYPSPQPIPSRFLQGLPTHCGSG